MKVSTGLYRLGSWVRHLLTARNTGGHGVHSPYLFEWVRMVMDDKNSYYVWAAIERVREQMLVDERMIDFVDYGSGKKLKTDNCQLKTESIDRRKVCDIAKKSLAKKKYAQMLARLVNWMGDGGMDNGDGIMDNGKGLTIVELGTSLGVTTAYLAAMDAKNTVLTYEGCEAVAAVAKENWKRLGLKNITCRVGMIDAEALAEELSRVDVAFVDANHTYAGTRMYVNILLEKMHEKSVLVIDDIHHSREMEKVWQEICADDRVTTSMDLYQMGLVFLDKNYWKRHYKMIY